MSSFRDQLGEDWLRYQHHLDGSSPAAFDTNQSPLQTPPLSNGLNATTSTSIASAANRVTEHLRPPLLSSEPKEETSAVDNDRETESTLQLTGHSWQPTESTLEESVVDGQLMSTTQPNPEPKELARGESVDTEEEEEEDLGGMRYSHASKLEILLIVAAKRVFL